MGKLKVLLVAGNHEMGRRLAAILKSDIDIEIAAEVNNAYAARDKIIECNPDVMLLCHDLPKMSGIEFLKKLIPQRHITTLVIAEKKHEGAAYDAGAKDFEACDKDTGTLEGAGICHRLKHIATSGGWVASPKNLHPELTKHPPDNTKFSAGIIAIGASTGGTEAVSTVIRNLRRNIPGIVLVQHMPEGYTHMFAQRLNKEGELSAKEAHSGDVVRPGHVLLAPGDKQMRIVRVNGMYQVECKHGPRVTGHQPSVDALFDSVARIAGSDAIGVLMTGMGADGAKGLLAMKKAGAHTIGQDEKTCIVYGMPKAAYEMGAVEWQVPLDQIAQKIHNLLDRKI